MKKNNNKRELKPRTENQAEYIRAISENNVTFCSGPAGTGKTSVAVGLACEYLVSKKVSKIVITRPTVESSSRGLGYLPGNFKEKIHPYLVPILDEMNYYLDDQKVRSMMSSDIIEIVPLEYMRGRNFHWSFMILDEAQNATFDQIKMFITRLGKGSKAVINGDLDQTDLPQSLSGGLNHCFDRLSDTQGVGICKLDYCDIVRSKDLARILRRLDPPKNES